MNRRLGGGGPRGNPRSSFSSPFQSGGGTGLNPWQGGMNQNQGGILSQLTSNPQLALALSNLLQPQQQQPPSLLSLNTSQGYSANRNFGDRFNRGRDNRRHEPYNKNRRDFGRRRSPKRDNKKKDDAKTKKDKKEEADSTLDDDEKKETKRDWKDEKNQTDGKESGDEAEGKKGDPKDKEGKYSGVDSKYLHCFVCNKQMWDGESMGKHVRGRAHHEMLKALEESMHICVNILRENLRLAEERKTIEYNRQGRQRKFQRREPNLSHCAMCDLKFMGKIVNHRRTDGHQRLKRYLHPTCRICDKEYPSRIEWVEHCLTPEHLRRLTTTNENKAGGKEGSDIIKELIEEEDLDLEPLLDEALAMEDEDPIVELDSSLDNMSSRLPAFKKDRPIGLQALKEFTGFMCTLCNRSFVDKDDADAHFKTRRHHVRFVEYIKDRFDREEKRKKAEKEAEEKAAKKSAADGKAKEENGEKEGEEEAEDGDQEMYDPTEATEEEKANGEGEEEQEEESEVKMETTAEEEEEEEKLLEEPAEVKKEEVKKEAPAPKPSPKKPAGARAKRGRK